jgi:hypothetical protein
MSKKDKELAKEQPEEVEAAQETEKKTAEIETNEDHAEHAKQPWLKRWLSWALGHKWIYIPVGTVVVAGLLAAIPFTRYAIAGMFLQQSFAVRVLDADTSKPISSATVKLAGTQAVTDSKGQVTLRTKVGQGTLEVTKKYYRTTSQAVLVPIKKPIKPLDVKLKATGRSVPIKVLNKISKKPVENVTVKTEGTEAKTDKSGAAIIVVPADKKEVQATLSGNGFNSLEVTLQVTSDSVPANNFEITASGKIYFLSNKSGKLDLVKSDLDGSNRQVVLAGTGKEDRFNTILLASRDWKNIALLSKRDGGEYAKLFLVETNNDKVTTMDEGEATFDVYGWSGDRFVYKVTRTKIKPWEAKYQALKSYSASAKKITTLYETNAEGSLGNYAYEWIEGVYVLDQDVLYTKPWSWTGYDASIFQGKQGSLNSVRADGSQKKTIKNFPVAYINSRAADFGEIYISYNESDKDKVEEYHDGKVTSTTLSLQDFSNDSYPFYSVSPSGKKTLWSDFRDGKYVFFVGDEKGGNGKQIGESEDYNVYGWYSDDYILVTKKGSEMHILPSDGLSGGGVDASIKVSDYYKPNYTNRGFGYGYGG